MPAALVARLVFATLALRPGSYVDEALKERHSDLLFSIQTIGGAPLLVYLLFEHQSTVDTLMVYRLLRYMVRIWEDYLAAHPEAKRWIFYSCNDDGVLGGVRASENQGLAASDVIGVGIDGSRACDAFGAGKPTGFRGTMYIDSAKEGAQAVSLLVASVKNNTPLPGTTYVTADFVSPDNFASYKDKLCHK